MRKILMYFLLVAVFSCPEFVRAKTLVPEVPPYSFFVPQGYVAEPWYAGDGIIFNGHIVTSDVYDLSGWLTTNLFVLQASEINQQLAESQAKLHCAADGGEGSIDCTESLYVRAFQNKYGVRGFRMMMKEERSWYTGKEVNIRLRGPIAVVQLSSKIGLVIQYNGNSPNGMNRTLFNTILRTIRPVK